MSVFECRQIGGALRADGDEILEVRYFASSDLAAVDLSPWAKLVLQPLTSHSGGSWIPAVRWRPPVSEGG
jgi:hypothetical protein